MNLDKYVISGIDEVGRGPLAGPVIACVVISNNHYVEGVKDSKKLSKTKREWLFKAITTNHQYAIGAANQEEIDEINILNATKLACKRAYDNLRQDIDLVLVDGNMKFDYPNFVSIIKGDDLFYSIAAGSIVAKVTRNNIMKELSLKHPEYLWNKNDGYGTAEHIAAINQYGLTRYHRRSFCKSYRQL